MRRPLLPGNDWKREKAEDRAKLRRMEKVFDDHYTRLFALYGGPEMSVKYKVSYARVVTDARWHYLLMDTRAGAEAMKIELQNQGHRAHITEIYTNEKDGKS